LNNYAFAAINRQVRGFRNILFALAAFLWLPASVHCQLESVSGLEFLQCSAASDSSHNPGQDCDECCAVEKSHYLSGGIRLTAPAPVSLPLLLPPAAELIMDLPVATDSLLTADIPPDLPRRWQFLSRTALPARAPSLAS
jgi:hypothetical protein